MTEGSQELSWEEDDTPAAHPYAYETHSTAERRSDRVAERTVRPTAAEGCQQPRVSGGDPAGGRLHSRRQVQAGCDRETPKPPNKPKRGHM